MSNYLFRFFIINLLFSSLTVFSQEHKSPKFFDASIEDLQWVDSVWQSLSNEEKIAQLFIVPHYTSRSYKEVEFLVREYNVGGVIFFKGKAIDQVNAVNRLNNVAKTPLVYTLDAEWGLGMRLPYDGISYPYAMTLGALQDDQLIYEMSSQIANQLKRVGVTVSYGPVADLNNNPLNPVISYRSFGENREKVTSKALAYMKGLEDHQVLAVAKHFPGHGDTNVDSHKSLPVIPHSRKRLDSLELYPFEQLIKEGIGGVMTAHLEVPALDDQASSLSTKVITDLLRDSLKFDGVIFTDGILMDAITKQFHDYGKADAQALVAGNDVVEFTNHIDKAIKEVLLAINQKKISWEQINEKGWRVLLMKRWLEVDKQKRLSTASLKADLQPQEAKKLIQEISDKAITVLKNSNQCISLDITKKVAIVNIGKSSTLLKKRFSEKQFDVESFYLSKNASSEQLKQLISKLSRFDVVVTQVGALYMSPGVKDIAVELAKEDEPIKKSKYPYGVTYTMLNYFHLMKDKDPKHIGVFFGNAYAIRSFVGIENIDGLIIGYQDLPELRKSVGKLLLGEINSQGKLPVTIDQRFKEGLGL
ncbi:glycoside hydrolase family 3 protein [Flammeovirga agarivorans]|uniref:beta-N-acetylhexosaminidase n=1 Tax=Flammeovirga agarivorans TaxID=2726742 RepID=A0A7X8XWZ4_9BACT|nr:glycoside hydrolase family 3 protein [Flammeovirga agarivorans]NLR92704.1 glycoside hydrolase family 3 protein [Flammeovirga agarivorans]